MRFFKHLLTSSSSLRRYCSGVDFDKIGRDYKAMEKTLGKPILHGPTSFVPDKVVNNNEGDKVMSVKPISEDEKKMFRQISSKSSVCSVTEMTFLINAIISDCSLLKERGSVKKIIKTVVENSQLSHDDEEVFKNDFRRWIREGSSKTKDVASDLFRIIFKEKNAKVIELGITEVYRLVGKNLWPLKHKDLPSRKWRHRECGFHLAALLVELDLLDLESFVPQYLTTPLLLVADVNRFPILRAAALKVLLVAARHGKTSQFLGRVELVDLLSMNIGATSNVVHSYAAICLSEVLVNEERFNGFDMSQVALALFRAMEFPGSKENEYLMKCVSHVLTFAEIDGRTAGLCFRKILREIFKNPQNEGFCKHLYESLAALLHHPDFLPIALHEAIQGDMLSQVMLLSQELVSSPSTDKLGFFLLDSVIQKLDYTAIEPYMTDVWGHLLNRFVNQETTEFSQSLVMYMSLFLVRYGPNSLVDSLNSVCPNIFHDVLKSCWIPNMKLIEGTIEIKVTAVAATRLICEAEALQDPAADNLCGEMLESILTLSEGVAKKEGDPLFFLCASLARVPSKHPGRYKKIIENKLTEANKAYLIKLCDDYNFQIV